MLKFAEQSMTLSQKENHTCFLEVMNIYVSPSLVFLKKVTLELCMIQMMTVCLSYKRVWSSVWNTLRQSCSQKWVVRTWWRLALLFCLQLGIWNLNIQNPSFLWTCVPVIWCVWNLKQLNLCPQTEWLIARTKIEISFIIISDCSNESNLQFESWNQPK